MLNKLLVQLTFNNGTLPEDTVVDRISFKDKSTDQLWPNHPRSSVDRQGHSACR